MLATQVQYWDLVERGRHNRQTEVQAQNELAESQRHNIVSESTNWFNARESARHNRAQEQETTRHNVAQESIGFATLNESARHNRAQENLTSQQIMETRRHNQRTESNEGYRNITGRLAQQSGSALDYSNVELNRHKGYETVSKTVKNYVDSAATVSGEVRDWFRTMKGR